MNVYLSLLECKCKKAYKACKATGASDDRMLFTTRYEMLVEAIEEEVKINSPVLLVATGKALRSEINELEQSAKSLKERGMI